MERLSATNFDEVRPDHLARYVFARDWLHRSGIEGTILDAGAGIGYGSNLLASVSRNVVSFEKSTEAREQYEKYFAAPNIEYRNEDIFRLSKDEKFDAIVCFEFIEHIPNPQDLLESFSICSPILICSTPNEVIRPHKKPPVNPHHYRHYTPDEFDGLLQDAGYSPIERYHQANGQAPRLRLGHMGKFMISVARRDSGASKNDEAPESAVREG